MSVSILNGNAVNREFVFCDTLMYDSINCLQIDCKMSRSARKNYAINTETRRIPLSCTQTGYRYSLKAYAGKLFARL